MIARLEHFSARARRFFLDPARVALTRGAVRLDASTLCQLRCPSCFHSGDSDAHFLGRGFLKYGDFQRFIDNNPEIRTIELSNYGEIFLNPELRDILRHAARKAVVLRARNGVNLNTVDDETLECLVRYGFRHLTVSIDGATNEVYQTYRKGGDLNKVLDNIKKINAFKKEYHSSWPSLEWQFIVFGHNEHQISTARAMAAELGMSFQVKLSYDPIFSPIRDEDLVRRESGLGVASREEYAAKYGRSYLLFCSELWKAPQINWDGRLLGCCVNRWADFGNVFEQGLEECLRGEKFVYTKRLLTGRERKERPDLPCAACPYLKEVLGRPLTQQAIGL